MNTYEFIAPSDHIILKSYDMIYPVITLYQPWATWIMRGWKTIETRTHTRFKGLVQREILIHAGKNTDKSEYAVNNPYLTREQIMYRPEEMVNGYILGSAIVIGFDKLRTHEEAKRALIECDTERFGLYLGKIIKFETPIPCKGEMGIWYFDMDKKEKVKKAV